MKYTFTICIGRVWVVIVFFLLRKQTFNGLLKVIGVQMILEKIQKILFYLSFYKRNQIIKIIAK